MGIKRFGVSLEADILKRLDDLVVINNFPNRSQAIRQIIQDQDVRNNLNSNRVVAGAIVIVYDHHKRDFNNQLVGVQHDFIELILSTQHVHVSHTLCLEIIAVRGPAVQLVDLSNRIIALKGIKHGKLVVTTLE